MSPRCYRTQRYTIKKNNIKRTLYFFVFWSIFAPMKILYTIVGTTSLILGIIGIFLPLLPTTPFLLLTAAMYFRSSPRWYHWLIQQKYLGSYIRNFREHKAIPLHAKIISVSLIWITLSYCAIWTLPYIWARILFLIIAIGTTWHILSYKTLYNPQIQISAESETKRSIFREKDKTKRSKKESAQHSKSRNKSFVMTSVSAL